MSGQDEQRLVELLREMSAGRVGRWPDIALEAADALEAAEREISRLEDESTALSYVFQGANKAAESAERLNRQLREALGVAFTLIERATFDAHDREWSREVQKQIRAALAPCPRPGQV